MLSSADIRQRIVSPDIQDEYLRLFEARNWKEILAKYPKYEKGIVIKDFNVLNLTPFSYDLSIGEQFFSVQKPEKGVVTLRPNDPPYLLDAGETVVLLTKELIAIPRHYSATAWPRFGMVREGVFQSMVKIDPTWWGHLAIAVSNLSPATFKLVLGKPFATLILYELTQPSDVDLWKPDHLEEADVNLLSGVSPDRLEEFLLSDPDLRKLVRVDNGVLKVRGLRRSNLDALSAFDKRKEWREYVNETVATAWAEKRHSQTGNRMIGIDALGMNSLRDIMAGAGAESRITPEDIEGKVCTPQELVAAARQYGRPFDTIAKIPLTVLSTMEKDTAPKIEARLEGAIQQRVIALMFSILGFLSLIVATIALLSRIGSLDALAPLSMTNGFGLLVLSIGGITVLMLCFLILHHWLLHKKAAKGFAPSFLQEFNDHHRREFSKLKSQLSEMGKREKELAKELVSQRKQIAALKRKGSPPEEPGVQNQAGPST
jgi:deoxycytidine triphosphate deaminase